MNSSDNLENLIRIGKMKREAPDAREFLGLLESGRVRLADARLAGLSAESRFDLAYNAAHALALAALRWHGYRVEHELEWKYETPKLLAAYEHLFSGGSRRR